MQVGCVARSLDCSELDGGSVRMFLVCGDGREVKPSKGRPRGAGGEEEKPNMVVVGCCC